MTDLREKAQALLDELDGNEYLTHKVIDSARIRDARNALRTALADDTGWQPIESHPQGVAGDRGISARS